jgi:hypothetical protein
MANYGLFYYNYYENPNLYAILNIVVSMIGGIVSPTVTAIICDKYDSKYVKIKAYVASG